MGVGGQSPTHADGAPICATAILLCVVASTEASLVSYRR